MGAPVNHSGIRSTRQVALFRFLIDPLINILSKSTNIFQNSEAIKGLPETDSSSERTNKMVGQAIRFHVERNQKGWARGKEISMVVA